MEPFKSFTAKAALLNRVNVDTDAVIPKQFLRSVGRGNLGKNAFYDWRYLDGDNYEPNPEFELNLPRHQDAQVLVTGDNFGCGSSREQAPWALVDFGLKTIVSTSFADIFYNNSIKNGLLPATVSPAHLDKLIGEFAEGRELQITVDLEAKALSTSTGLSVPFSIPDHARDSLVSGLDDIGTTMKFMDKIEEFEQKSKAKFPWLG
jgi:3-isopropylmalate/(R)-2-methylmalate dehydratase small subunit